MSDQADSLLSSLDEGRAPTRSMSRIPSEVKPYILQSTTVLRCACAEVRRIIGVANRAISDDEARQLAERLGIQEGFVVPEDPEIEKADQLGTAAVDPTRTPPR